MSEPSDLEKHRRTLTERLDALGKDLERQSEGNLALYEFITLLHQVLSTVEAQLDLQQAEHLLFSKMMLGGVRLSESWEDYKGRCLKLEEKLGFHHPKK